MEQELLAQITILLAKIKEMGEVDPEILVKNLVTWIEEIPIE